MARAADLESTSNRRAKGNRAATLTMRATSDPCFGETPRIIRSHSSWMSGPCTLLFPSARLETTNSRPRMSANVSRTTSDSSMTKIRFIRVGVAIDYRPCGLADRHVDKKSGSFSDLAFDGDEPAVFLNDLMRHCKSQTAPFILAGKERVKNMLRILCRNADPGVANFHLHKLAGGLGPFSRDGPS